VRTSLHRGHSPGCPTTFVVLHLERVANVEDRQLARQQLVVVHPNAQVAARPQAAQDDVAYAGMTRQPVAQIQIDVVSNVLERAFGR